MIKSHPSLLHIEDDCPLWRYVDFDKFKDLLTTKELYFRRLDLYEDTCEGELTERDKEWMSYIFSHKFVSQDKSRYFICCWHIADEVSSFMWNNYGHIAIKTTAESLKKCYNGERTIYLNRVWYVDETGSTQDGGTPINMLKIAFTKRSRYSDENEARLLICLLRAGADNPDFLRYKIDLDALIHEIVISPEAPQNLRNEVENLLSEAGLDKSIVLSEG